MLQRDQKPLAKTGGENDANAATSKLKEAAARAREILASTDTAIADANAEPEETEIERISREARENYRAHLKNRSPDQAPSKGRRDSADIGAMLIAHLLCSVC